MRTSEIDDTSLAELAPALAAAQGEFPKLTKDTEGQEGHRTYKYATYGQLHEVVQPILAKHGLSLIQTVGTEDGVLVLNTMVLHKSGEYIHDSWPLPSYEKPKEQGSVLSYWRRYQAMGVLNLAAEDDDGEAAQRSKPKAQEPKHKPGSAAAATGAAAQEAAVLTAVAELMSHKAKVKEWRPEIKTVPAARTALLELVRDIAKALESADAEVLVTQALAVMEQDIAEREVGDLTS